MLFVEDDRTERAREGEVLWGANDQGCVLLLECRYPFFKEAFFGQTTMKCIGIFLDAMPKLTLETLDIFEGGNTNKY